MIIGTIVEKALVGGYIGLWFGGAGVVSIALLWGSLKWNKTRGFVKEFFHID